MIATLEHFPQYNAVGPPLAFPIVFVHGAAWSCNMWTPQLQALSQEI
jgi:pimeloyl-ACP methyl ester carboxylesterase